MNVLTSAPTTPPIQKWISRTGASDLMRVEWLKEVLPNPEDQREYAREHTTIVLTEAVGEAMEEANINRLTLASTLGRHKSYVTRALSAHQNITLKTLSDLLWACGVEIASVTLAPIGEALLPRAETDSFIIEAVTRPMPTLSVPWLSADSGASAGSMGEPAVTPGAPSTATVTAQTSSALHATTDSIGLAA